jgi:hypothetical protein
MMLCNEKAVLGSTFKTNVTGQHYEIFSFQNVMVKIWAFWSNVTPTYCAQRYN